MPKHCCVWVRRGGGEGLTGVAEEAMGHFLARPAAHASGRPTAGARLAKLDPRNANFDCTDPYTHEQTGAHGAPTHAGCVHAARRTHRRGSGPAWPVADCHSRDMWRLLPLALVLAAVAARGELRGKKGGARGAGRQPAMNAGNGAQTRRMRLPRRPCGAPHGACGASGRVCCALLRRGAHTHAVRLAQLRARSTALSCTTAPWPAPWSG